MQINGRTFLNPSEHEPCPICEARAAERVRREEVMPLAELLEYWLPDETKIPHGHEKAWYAATEALAKVKP